MKLTKNLLALFVNLSLVSATFLSFAIQSAQAQDTKIALQRGYRTGYSDGYMSGYRDSLDNQAKNFQRHSEYAKADRAYNKDYGTLEDYRDGYQQGFEIGYNTGFDKKAFDATIPTDLKKRGVIAVTTSNQTTTTQTETATTNNPVTTNTQVSENTTNNQITTTTENNYVSNTDAIILIPANIDLTIELLDEITTERNREGDKFTARIISPVELTGAIVEGRITKIKKPGRIKRRAEVNLTFDRIVLAENRWSNFGAILTEILPSKGDNVKNVDTEGTVKGKSSLKSDAIKVGASTGTGLVVGAIVGGPVGAGVGAAVGAAFGVGAVVVERGKHIRLNKNQQLKIKTVYETQIR
jgi:type IV secretion system protein VirB10